MKPLESRPLARSLNSAAVLRSLVLNGPVSRAALARETGLSAVTVGAIVTELIEQGLVVDSGDTDATAGRPGRLLRFNSGAFVAIGVKLADRRLVGAITDLRATVLAEAHLPLDRPTPSDLIAALNDLVVTLLDETSIDRDRLLGVGIGLPGVVDQASGTTHHSPFLEWTDVPLVGMAEEALGVPVFIENDVSTLALTERWFGIGQDVSDFLLVTIGQGIGLGVVIDGRLHSGARGGVGEFGHMVVDDSTAQCACGNTGCLEATTSEPALLRQAAALAADKGLEPVKDLRELYQRALSDADHAAIVLAAGEALGRGIANLINVLAPEMVILTGDGLFEGSMIAESIAHSVESHVFAGLHDRYRLLIEQLPDGPWARGAASLVLSELFMSPDSMSVGSTPGVGGGARR